jgi:hypothetical protein
MTMRFTARLVLTLVLASCRAAPSVVPLAGWRVYHGQGFTLHEPGIVEPRVEPPGLTPYAGTRLQLTAPAGIDAEGVVVVSTFVLPRHTSPKAWIDSVWAGRVVPTTDPDAWANEEKPERVSGIDGEAWRLEPQCGDCEWQDVFIFRKEQVVLLSFLADAPTSEGRELARRDFRRLLASFRWDR